MIRNAKAAKDVRQERAEIPVEDQIPPLTPEDRKQARDAFNAIMDAPDDDPEAVAMTLLAKALLS
jgi:hypothetical protein